MDIIVRIRQLLANGGIRLHKWISYICEVMSALPKKELVDDMQAVNLLQDQLLVERSLRE